MNKVDEDGWVLAAYGELGDVVNWEPEYAAVGRARDLLCLLEEIGEDKVDWKYLLQGLPSLGVIELLNFPPLYNENAFDEIDGFFTIVKEPLIELPGMSFNRIDIYIDPEFADKLIEQFKVLSDRLHTYEPLAPFL